MILELNKTGMKPVQVFEPLNKNIFMKEEHLKDFKDHFRVFMSYTGGHLVMSYTGGHLEFLMDFKHKTD